MRGRLGGTCLNVGCIPSKALLTSSHHYHDVLHNFASHGINAENVTLDVGRMLQSKEETVEGLTGGIEFLFKKNKVDYYVGKGSIPSPNAVAVAGNDPATSTELSAKNILIATGSEVSPLPPVPVDNSVGKIVDSTGALDIASVRA
jgi:dihydrolipoamide dehydrogenase